MQFNPNAFLPQDVFTELNLEDLDQVLGSIDPDMMEMEFAFALDTNRLETIAVADLILVLLLKNNDAAAAHVTERLYNSVERQGTGVASYQWLNTLTEVIPYAVVMEKWDFLNLFLTKSVLDPAAICGLLTLAAHVCLAKEKWDQALKYLTTAKEFALRDSLPATAPIDELVAYAESKLAGDNEPLSHLFPESDSVSSESSLEAEQEKFLPVLRRWQLRLGGTEEDKPWHEAEDLSFLFQRFRPDGHEVEQFCIDMGCETIVPRLIEIFHATGATAASITASDAYFVVRTPQPATDQELLSLSTTYLNILRDVAHALPAKASEAPDDIGLQALSTCLPTIAISSREAPMEATDFQVAVNEELYDYFHSRIFDNAGAKILREALYTMACDYSLVHYILWPLTKPKDDRYDFDPFSPYLELWKRGVDLRFEDKQSAVLYLTGQSDKKEQGIDE